jgi:dynein heavy chain 2
MQLNDVQRKWVYLEPIFARGALPHEQQRFRRVDDEFRQIIKSITIDPKVSALSTLQVKSRTRVPQKLTGLISPIQYRF